MDKKQTSTSAVGSGARREDGALMGSGVTTRIIPARLRFANRCLRPRAWTRAVSKPGFLWWRRAYLRWQGDRYSRLSAT